MYRPRSHQPHQQNQPQGYRLPKQQSMPGVKDLEFALAEAGRRKGTSIELPWGQDYVYVLSVLVGDAEPLWSLFQGEAMQALLWRHHSRDLALVHSLVFQAVPDEMASAAGFGGVAGAKPPAAAPAVAVPLDTAKASLQGRLENMQMATLIQSIQMSNMSGRLFISDKGSNAQIFFVDGVPVHATTAEATGDLAVVETMTWEEGDFKFYPGESTEDRTIKRRLDAMIMEGITFLDQKKYLNSQGLKPESYLVRKDAHITVDEFRNRLAKGAPLDLQVQKVFYDMIDGRSRLQDILQRRFMTKAEWLPILFNFVSCGLINISETSPSAGSAAGLAGTEVDRTMIQNVLRTLVRGETGMFTYPAFLFLLEQEFSKSVVLSIPLSILIFEARLPGAAGETPQPLPIPALREVTHRIEALKRPFDVVAHYETFDFAVMLPGTSAKKARVVANMIADILTNSPVIQGQTRPLLLACGIASAPEDTQEMSKLMSAAREAKNKAKEQRVPARAFGELIQKH